MPPKHKIVVLTRSTEGNQAWLPILQAHDIHTYALPTIETTSRQLLPEDESTLQQLVNFDWLVLTSSASVYYLQAVVKELGIAHLESVSVAAIGAETARAASSVGLQVSFQPTQPDSSALGAELPDIMDKTILLPQSAIASTELAQLLRARGARVTTIALYDTQPIRTPDEQFDRLLQNGDIGILIFASPSAVHGFSARVAKDSTPLTLGLSVIAIGPETAKAAAAAGYAHIQTSKKPSIDGIIEAITQLSS